MAISKGAVERPRTVRLEASSRRIERLVTNRSELIFVPEVWENSESHAHLAAVLRPLALFQRLSDSTNYGTTFEHCHDLVCFVTAEAGNCSDDFGA